MKSTRDDDGWIIAGFLLLVLVAAIAVGGYFGYRYWEDNKNTTPPPAPIPPGSEEISGNGVTLVIPRGWSEASVRDKQIQRTFDAVVAANPNAADKAGVDQMQINPDLVAFAAVEGGAGKNAESLNVVAVAGVTTDLTSLQSAYNVQLQRLGASKIRWEETRLDVVDALQVDFEQVFGPVTVYQRQYMVIGDNEVATLTFNALAPIGNKKADEIANTMRVD